MHIVFPRRSVNVSVARDVVFSSRRKWNYIITIPKEKLKTKGADIGLSKAQDYSRTYISRGESKRNI